MAAAYDELAGVYDWLVPEPLVTPAGSANAFADVVQTLEPGARVLDCASGTGNLAIGLAEQGFTVVASDASSEMVRSTRTLAARHGVELTAETCRWDELGQHRGWDRFDAIFCVGNSLGHAAGGPARRAALAGMASVLRDGGVLVVTSRNWAQLRAVDPHWQVADRLIERGGRKGLVIYRWTLPARWEAEHVAEVAVAVLGDDDTVTTTSARLSFWPFRHEELQDDLRVAGFTPTSTTYQSRAERYLVTARRNPAA